MCTQSHAKITLVRHIKSKKSDLSNLVFYQKAIYFGIVVIVVFDFLTCMSCCDPAERRRYSIHI